MRLRKSALIAETTNGLGLGGLRLRIPKPRFSRTLVAVIAVSAFLNFGQAFGKGSSKGGSTDGASPMAGLVMDSTGNLYGTTYTGGIGDGTVFKLTPPATSGEPWTESVLLMFDGADGNQPLAGLITDAKGNLYGTTATGGAYDDGTVFELKAPSTKTGTWTQSILLSLNGKADGFFPQADLLLDPVSGDLYGTAVGGGANGDGTVFELKPPASGGSWIETTLLSFDGIDGDQPAHTGLVADGTGNLYGTTYFGGTGYGSSSSGYGTVFELKPPATGGSWTESVLWNFEGAPDGRNPVGLTMYDGNLYGTTVIGGTGIGYNGSSNGAGTVFELTSNGGSWNESILDSFNGTTDGLQTYGGVIADSNGNLYGTTEYGGLYNYGTVFELTPTGTGGWDEQVLWSFNFNGSDGAQPQAGLIIDRNGNLYGTTVGGGTSAEGTVFELKPPTSGESSWTESVLYSFTGKYNPL